MKFEDGLKRLEEIVRMLEEGNVGLDEAISIFKEGMELSKELMARLDEAERKIEILIKREDGTYEKKPFLKEEE